WGYEQPLDSRYSSAWHTTHIVAAGCIVSLHEGEVRLEACGVCVSDDIRRSRIGSSCTRGLRLLDRLDERKHEHRLCFRCSDLRRHYRRRRLFGPAIWLSDRWWYEFLESLNSVHQFDRR